MLKQKEELEEKDKWFENTARRVTDSEMSAAERDMNAQVERQV